MMHGPTHIKNFDSLTQLNWSFLLKYIFYILTLSYMFRLPLSELCYIIYNTHIYNVYFIYIYILYVFFWVFQNTAKFWNQEYIYIYISYIPALRYTRPVEGTCSYLTPCQCIIIMNVGHLSAKLRFHRHLTLQWLAFKSHLPRRTEGF